MGKFNKEVFRISYEVLKKKVVAANPDFSEHDINIETAQRFRPRFFLDMATVRHEDRGTKKYAVGDIELLSTGDIYYRQYGVTLEELNENTRLYNPNAYLVTDHQASRLAAQRLHAGASIVAFASARKGSDNRDIQVLTIDPVTKKGISITINAASDGGLHTFSEMQRVIQNLFPELTQVQPQENVSIFTDRPTSVERARQIVSRVNFSQQLRTGKVVRENNHDMQKRTNDFRAFRSQDDKKLTVVKTETKIANDRRRAIRDIFVYRQKGWIELQPNQSINRGYEKIKHIIIDANQRRYTDMKKTALTLWFAGKTQVAIGAVPLLVASLAKEIPQPLRAVEKSIARHQKKEAKRLYKEKKKIRERQKRHAQESIERGRKMDIEDKLRRREPKQKRKKSQKERTVFSKETQRKKKKDKPFQFKEQREKKQTKYVERSKMKKGKERFVKKEKRLTKNTEKMKRGVVKMCTEKALIRALTLWAKKLKQKREEGESRAIRTVSKKIEELLRSPTLSKKAGKEQIPTVGFSFAWILWLLFEPSRRRRLRPKVGRADNLGKTEIIPEGIITQEQRQWLLLCIIWYLTMIQETGLGNKKNYKHAGHHLPKPFAQTGVIFAYQSW